ncbi:hypothetical protein [Anaeromyxobacter oryzisoli]|uniref:hypothetical protein n=1 Tax=Anaeromyxobacter oryzisoli TaxID=2925408 RepID=UPI001F55DA4E|nr:hypothetical protein [Anaeromyxobacter sp. SG63]
MTRARRVVFGVTVVMWVGVCAVVLLGLIRGASEAPPGTIEEYARAPGFQVLNFVAGYLPMLVLVVVALLGLEHLALRIAERRLNRDRKSVHPPR